MTAPGTYQTAPATFRTEVQDEALRCVRCGFCLQACPTYRQTGIETASPRGRIAVILALAEGRLSPGPEAAGPLDLCLGCRACEAVCPSGIRYGWLLESARAALESALEPRRPWPVRLARRVGFALVARPRWLRGLAALLAAAQKTGLLRAAAALLPRRLRHLREMALALPPAPTPALRRQWRRLLEPLPDGQGWRVPAAGPRRYRVGFFPGCVMDALFLSVNLAAVRVLAAAGCEVVIPAGAGCCGALHVHAGLQEDGIALARQNAAAFARVGPLDAVIQNAGGCGAHVQEYGRLLAGTPEAEAGAALARLSRDLSRWLVEVGLGAARLGPVPGKVTYQPSCHLENGQGVRAEPRQLLRAIPGLELVEMADADRCCGSAGIYNLTQPAMATALLDEKMARVRATGAETVVVTNPGCHLQMLAGVHRAGLAGRVRVRHLAEVLAEALAAAGGGAGA
ncbi:MAG: heterodisulfide reductase-related iron-sulfur binding cluster [Bacillota bacterium]